MTLPIDQTTTDEGNAPGNWPGGWLNGEWKCKKCGTIIGKNLRGEPPFALAAEHQTDRRPGKCGTLADPKPTCTECSESDPKSATDRQRDQTSLDQAMTYIESAKVLTDRQRNLTTAARLAADIAKVESQPDCSGLAAELEKLIDLFGLANVLTSMSGICFDKVSHLLTNWQDKPLSQNWETAGNRLNTLATQDCVKAVS